jgi:hypothetical protein
MIKRCCSVRCPQRTGSSRSDGESAETADSTAPSIARRDCEGSGKWGAHYLWSARTCPRFQKRRHVAALQKHECRMTNDEGMPNEYNALAAARVENWGTYASRVWVVASSRRRTFMGSSRLAKAFGVASTQHIRKIQECSINFAVV